MEGSCRYCQRLLCFLDHLRAQSIDLLIVSCIELPLSDAQAMHKAPILESKQIEHVLNERRILEEASGHPFCVGLVRAYQDKPCLYLLQEWVGGMPAFFQTA